MPLLQAIAAARREAVMMGDAMARSKGMSGLVRARLWGVLVTRRNGLVNRSKWKFFVIFGDGDVS